MTILKFLMWSAFAVGAVLTAGCGGSTATSDEPTPDKSAAHDKRSSFGVYEGYDPILYTDFIRESVYVPMRDGVRIAVEIYRPAENGTAVKTPYPVLLMYSGYPRVQGILENGNLATNVGEIDPETNYASLDQPEKDPYVRINKGLIARGYVMAIASARGSGASFGVSTGGYSQAIIDDAHDLIEWFADQPFSTGRVGMFGSSWYGDTQVLATTAQPPSLKAIFPEVAIVSGYDYFFRGAGVLQKASFAWMQEACRNIRLTQSTA
ncbi:MAG: CocE/NonD family hydrolase [Pseudomonadota bacterium]